MRSGSSDGFPVNSLRLLTPRLGRLLALAVGAGLALAAFASAATPFVTAQVPLDQTVDSLVAGKFTQYVKCQRTCRIKATIFIRPAVARQLGFTNVRAGQKYAIGTKSVRLLGGRRTAIRVIVSDEAKRRLPRLKQDLQLIGEVPAASTTTRVRGQANWVTTLVR